MQFQVQPHPRFKRKGTDILAPLPLRLSEALLGCRKMVETAWGSRSLTVPPGTQGGAQLAIDGAGAPRIGAPGRGRHIAEIRVSLPHRLSAEQQALIEQLRDKGL